MNAFDLLKDSQMINEQAEKLQHEIFISKSKIYIALILNI